MIILTSFDNVVIAKVVKNGSAIRIPYNSIRSDKCFKVAIYFIFLQYEIIV